MWFLYPFWLKLHGCILEKTSVHGSGAGNQLCGLFAPSFRVRWLLSRRAMPIDQDTLEAIVHAVTTAMSVQQQAGSRGDTKAIGGPPEWNSHADEGGFAEWHIKMKAWLTNHDSRAQRWLNAARDTAEVIESDDLDVQHFTDEKAGDL